MSRAIVRVTPSWRGPCRQACARRRAAAAAAGSSADASARRRRGRPRRRGDRGDVGVDADAAPLHAAKMRSTSRSVPSTAAPLASRARLSAGSTLGHARGGISRPRRAAARPGDKLDVDGAEPPLALGGRPRRRTTRGALRQRHHARGQRANVDEDVGGRAVRRDESEAPAAVEKFHGAEHARSFSPAIPATVITPPGPSHSPPGGRAKGAEGARSRVASPTGV